MNLPEKLLSDTLLTWSSPISLCMNLNITDLPQFGGPIRNIAFLTDSVSEIQNPIMQPQMISQSPMMPPQMVNPILMPNDKKNFSFKNACKGNRDVSARKWRTVEQLLNKYMNEVYGTTNIRLTFLYDAKKINRTEYRTLEDFFSKDDIPVITVMEM